MSLIPSTSSSSGDPQIKHDVFLSFRGEDTRNNFTSHLHKALRDKRIDTFIDYELHRGDEISTSLLEAIEESQISIIILSENYASSGWCLEELVKILECKNREKNKQIVIPVFYGVDPSDVRHQTGSYEKAFAKHEKRFKESLAKVQKWKNALNEAGSISGWDSSVIRPESDLIEDIVQDVLEKMMNNLSSSDTSDFVGLNSQIKEIESLLCLGSKHVRSVGLWGMGGIGKTTLAQFVFNKISCQFEGFHFFENVREKSEKSVGLDILQRELCSALLGDKNANVGTFSVGVGRAFMKKKLGRKKILIVFDDVSNFRQIEDLIGGFDILGPQSRIVMTTRDKQVLESCRVDQVYEVQELFPHEALKLFCRYAFKENQRTRDYMEISYKLASYAGGIPLALKVLGSYLHGKGKKVWISAMEKLEKIPHLEIHQRLKISYDGLDDEVRKIFLDIACFFIGSEIGPVKVFLDACGFSSEIGISILTDNNLIVLSNDVIKMHDLLQAMGREIVRQESIEDPEKRSRLWYHEDICCVLTTSMGTKKIEGISLDMSNTEDMYLNQQAFANMRKLRFLKFYCSSNKECHNKVHGFEALESNFAELRYINWYKFPLKSLPTRFHLKKLVTLEMHNSKLEQLWDHGQSQHLPKLKEVDLSFSDALTSCTDISSFPNLEKLVLNGCTNLREIPSSIQCLSKLNVLNLTSCFRLRSLPDCSGLTSLRKLVLSYCSNLKMLSEMPCNLEELRLTGTAIEELPSSIENLSRLVILDLNNCSRLKILPSSICKWKSLEILCLSDCARLDKLPDDIGTLESLKRIRVEGTSIRDVPPSIIYLNNLYELSFRRCKGLLLPPLLGNSLGELDLTDCGITKLPDNVGCLSSLKILNLGENILESIPASFINLSNLQSLDISFCERPLPDEVISIEPSSSFVSRYIEETHTLRDILHMIAVRTGPRYCTFTNCFKLDQKILEMIVKDNLKYIVPVLRLATKLKQMNRNKGFEDAPSTVNICFPGSEIPSHYFDHKSSGSLIMVELKEDWLQDDFVGFRLFAVASFRKHRTKYNLSIACRYTTSKDGQRHVVSEVFVETPYIDCPYKSRHVIIGFDSRLFPRHISESLCSSDEVSFKFQLMEFDDSSKHFKLCNKVERCGVHLMYAWEDYYEFFRIPYPDPPLSIDEEDETNQDNEVGIDEHGRQWKIIFENGCEVKVICEDLGMRWKIDPLTGKILDVRGQLVNNSSETSSSGSVAKSEF